MQTIALGSSGRDTTRLGFGCSSLMGATGRRESLALLEAAYDAGIRHFDVAPMYGYGAAEALLGEFLQRHPAELTVTTKYGIPPAGNQSLMGLARRVAGPIVKSVPALKRRLASAAAGLSGPAQRASFTATQAAESLHRSLAALRTDHVDVWLLHEVEAADLTDEGLLRFLEESVRSGKIGTFGVGSEAAKVEALLQAAPAYCRTLQFEWSVFDEVVPASGPFRIHHRSLADRFRLLHAELGGDPAKREAWSRTMGIDLSQQEVLASVMLKAALVFNPDSVVLFSSKRPENMARNAAVAGDISLEAPARRLYELLHG